MSIRNLRERISGRSLDRADQHRGDDDAKSISSARTSMSSKSSRTRLKVVSPTSASRPTLGAFFHVSKQQVIIAQRTKVNHRQKELSVRKNRKSSILASLDKFIDGDDRDEATYVTTETVPISDHSISSQMSLERMSRPPPLAQGEHPTKRNDSASSQSLSVGGEAPPRKERYRRRGSVTKFSLDDQQEDGSSREFDDSSATKSSIGVDSVQSDTSVLQNSGSSTSTRRYHRRGSVTKFSLEATQEEQAKQPERRPKLLPKLPKVQKGFDDNDVSLSSFGGDSVQSDNVPPGRFRRRNSVTKFSLESTTEHVPKKDTLSSSNSSLPVSSTIGGDHGSFSSLGTNISALCDEDGLGYGSMYSTAPPPRTTPSPVDLYGYREEETDSVPQRPPRKERYRRRGSVTKYSLEAQDLVKKELQAGSALKKKKELEDSSIVNKELDSSTRSLQFEELVARPTSVTKINAEAPSRPPRHPLNKNRLSSQPIS